MVRTGWVLSVLLLCLSGCGPDSAESTPTATSGPRAKAYLNMPTTRKGAVPRVLSQVGAFDDLKALRPVAGLVAYEINAPFWSDGALKRRWIGLPAGRHIKFSADGEWKFPPGTVFVKHFELPLGDQDGDGPRTRLETRVLVCDAEGGVYGASYKWRADGSDADLVSAPITVPVSVEGANRKRKQNWYFPGVDDCQVCHTPAAGGVLGVKTRQLNRAFGGAGENQLVTWKRLGFFGPGPEQLNPQSLSRLCRVDDDSQPIERRARSFLDVNCGNCHRPGGVAGNFDARYDTPLARQNLIGGPVLIDLGIDRAKVIAPHDVWRSLALVRVETSDRTRMPPLAHERIDEQGARVLRTWIESLPGPRVLPPPAISPRGGEFRDPVRAVLSNPEPGATIHYTLDGSAPGLLSPIYSGPMTIKEPTTLRARAYKDGMTRSISVQETYIVND